MYSYEYLRSRSPEEMMRDELDQCFLPDNWNRFDVGTRRSCLQMLENNFASEQGRLGKKVVVADLDEGTLGQWNSADDTIYVSRSLLENGTLDSAIGPVRRPDAPFLLYNTVAHEGYHAYQSYIRQYPWMHGNPEEAEEWRINSAVGVTGHGVEQNYVSPEKSYTLYRIQPLERDATCYGDEMTHRAFDPILAESGMTPEFEEYEDFAEHNSYEKALRSEMARDPECVEHMMQHMKDNCQRWEQQSAEEQQTAQEQQPSEKEQPSETQPPTETAAEELAGEEAASYSERPLRYEEAAKLDDPYKNDVGHYEHALVRSLSGSNRIYVPSLAEQYAERVEGLNAEYPDRGQDAAQKSQYMEQLYRTQEELGYFPEFDERAREGYDACMGAFDEHYADKLENGSEEVKALVAENREELEAAYRDSTGYYPNRPQEHSEQETAQPEETQDVEPAPEETQEIESAPEESFDMDGYLSAGTQPGETQDVEFAPEESFDMDGYLSAGAQPEETQDVEPAPEETQDVEPAPEESFDMDGYLSAGAQPEETQDVEPTPEETQDVEPAPEETQEIESAPEETESVDMSDYAGASSDGGSGAQESESEEEEQGQGMSM